MSHSHLGVAVFYCLEIKEMSVHRRSAFCGVSSYLSREFKQVCQHVPAIPALGNLRQEDHQI